MTSNSSAGRTRLASPLVVGVLCALIGPYGTGLARPSLATSAAQSGGPGADWTGFGGDAGRSSASAAPTGIGAGNIASLRRQQVPLEGTVDASPIYLHDVRVNGASHDVFFVTTTYGRTIAIDADDGARLWTWTPPDYETWAGSYRITTSTPVADPGRAFIYAAAPDGTIQKLAVADGRPAWRVAITLFPQREKIASPLNYFDGRVIAVTGGYIGDAPPYQGHVVVVDAETGAIRHVWNALCSDRAGLIQPRTCAESGAAIWGRNAPVIDTTTGHIFVATGDGRWDGRTHWGDAVLELDRDATTVLGNYTPSNTSMLDATDADLGSTAPALLGGDLIAQGGKDLRIRLLDLAAMRGADGHQDHEVQVVTSPGGVLVRTAPAVWHDGARTWLFTADLVGTAAWQLRSGRLEVVWEHNPPGTSPLLAAGLLYVYDPGGGLRVYDARSGRQVALLECGPGHWNSPIVVDGRIALPEGNANNHQTTGVLNIWRAAR